MAVAEADLLGLSSLHSSEPAPEAAPAPAGPAAAAPPGDLLGGTAAKPPGAGGGARPRSGSGGRPASSARDHPPHAQSRPARSKSRSAALSAFRAQGGSAEGVEVVEAPLDARAKGTARKPRRRLSFSRSRSRDPADEKGDKAKAKGGGDKSDKRKGRSKDEEDAAGTPPSGRGKFMGMKAKVRRRSKDSASKLAAGASSEEESSALLSPRGADSGGGGKKRASSRSARGLDHSGRRDLDSSDRRRGGLDSSDRRRGRSKKGAAVHPAGASASDSEGDSSLLGFMPRDEFLVRQQQQNQQNQKSSDRSVVEGSGPQKSAPWAARMLNKKKKPPRGGRSADGALRRSGHDEGERSASERDDEQGGPERRGREKPASAREVQAPQKAQAPQKVQQGEKKAGDGGQRKSNKNAAGSDRVLAGGSEHRAAVDRALAGGTGGQRRRGDVNASERAPASDRMIGGSEHRMASASEHGAGVRGPQQGARGAGVGGRVHPPGGRVPPQGPPTDWRAGMGSRRRSLDYNSSGHGGRDASGHGPMPPFGGGRGDGPMFVRGPKGRPTLRNPPRRDRRASIDGSLVINSSMRRLGLSELTMETDAAAVWDGVTNNGGSGRRRQLSSPLQAPPPADRRAVMDKNSETAGNALRRLSSSCQLDYYGADRRVDMRRISGLSGSFHGLDTADVPDVPVSGLVGEEGFVAVMTMDLKDAPRRRDRANSWDSTHHSRSSGILAEFEDELSRSGASGLGKSDYAVKDKNESDDEDEDDDASVENTVKDYYMQMLIGKKRLPKDDDDRSGERTSELPECHTMSARKLPAKMPSGSKPRQESDAEYMRRKLESFNAQSESAKKDAAAESKPALSPDSLDAKRKAEASSEHPPKRERRSRRLSFVGKSSKRESSKRSRSARRDLSGRASRRKDRGSPDRSPRGPEGDEDPAANTDGDSLSENGDKRRNYRNGVLLSPWMMLTMCVWYCVSLVAVAVLGFWLHMRFIETYEASAGARESGAPDFRNPGDDPQFRPIPPGYQLVATVPSARPSAPPGVLEGANGTTGLITTQSSGVGTQAPSSSSEPSGAPSIGPSLVPTATGRPSTVPSWMPSASPTGLPGCPDELTGSRILDDDGLVTLRYAVVTYKGNMGGGVGGLLCVSLEYEGIASWIGLAFSEAKRDPQFGRKEAVIGIPGLETSTAMTRPGDDTLHSGLGQTNDPLPPDKQPVFRNPGKHVLPAGGVDGYSGPSLFTMSPADRQSLQNAAVDVQDMSSTGIVTSEGLWRTTLSFGKYLREPGEIQIDPAADTLVLYAVSPADGGPGPADGNPDWESTPIRFDPSQGSGGSTTKSHLRKRIRVKEQDEEDPP